MANKEKRNYSAWLWPILVLLGVLGLWVLNLNLGLVIGKPDEVGQFGDQFGAVNALFSGLAFAGIIYALIMQRQDLRMQREEMALQREEMGLQRDELKLTREQFEQQNLNGLFFKLLEHQKYILENTEEAIKKVEGKTQIMVSKSGNQLFSDLVELHKELARCLKKCKWTDFAAQFMNRSLIPTKKYGNIFDIATTDYQIRQEHFDLANSMPPESVLILAYSFLYRKHEASLGPYFAHFKEILNVLEDGGQSWIETQQRKKYGAFLSAQLTSVESYLLLMHTLLFPDEFRLVRELELVKNLPLDYFIGPMSHLFPWISAQKSDDLITNAMSPDHVKKSRP